MSGTLKWALALPCLLIFGEAFAGFLTDDPATPAQIYRFFILSIVWAGVIGIAYVLERMSYEARRYRRTHFHPGDYK